MGQDHASRILDRTERERTYSYTLLLHNTHTHTHAYIQVRDLAEQHGVKLLEDAHLPDKSTWTDADARKKFAQEKADLVKSKNLHGVFFDYEGNGLSKDQKQAYTLLAKEVKDAVNGTVVVCVGGRPTYEWRDYDYTGLASASDFLFVMGYDLIAWDDYTCITKGTCSPADAPIKDLELGLNEYLKDVPSSNLVLGLPWYGNRYTDVLVPFNDGQIDYKDVLAVYVSNNTQTQQQQQYTHIHTYIHTGTTTTKSRKRDSTQTLKPT